MTDLEKFDEFCSKARSKMSDAGKIVFDERAKFYRDQIVSGKKNHAQVVQDFLFEVLDEMKRRANLKTANVDLALQYRF